MNHELDRRYAFWDFFKREYLDAAIRELDKRKADKWLDEFDAKTFCEIHDALFLAMSVCLKRYRNVIDDVIRDMQEVTI